MQSTAAVHRSRTLGGKPHAASSLADNRFVHALKPVAAAPEAFPAAQATLLEPRAHLDSILSGVLQDDPARMAQIQQKTRDAFAAFAASSHPDRAELTDALMDYVSPSTGYHVLMNAAACGHRSIDDFVHAMNHKDYRGADGVEKYCADFIGFYRLDGDVTDSDSDSGDEAERFTSFDLESAYDDLTGRTRTLQDFLSAHAVDLSGVKLVHGVAAGNSAPYSVAVDPRSYLKAFIEKSPIVYDSFISTTSDTATALAFTGYSKLPGVPAGALDLSDTSSAANAHRRALLDQLSNPATDPNKAAILLVMDCDDAKGVYLGPETTGQRLDEQELLLGPNHVVQPQSLVYGDGFYVLSAKLTAADDRGIA
ncbi:hypothetical protein SAMN03159339_6794 [Variovorax sp. 770b2]|nr:hypothetical protein SAMN03159339_6794 [Variovorax sp. 770b2]